MKFCKTVNDLVVLAMSDTVGYTAASEKAVSPIGNPKIATSFTNTRTLFITDETESSVTKVLQIETNKLLETVDVLEQMRIGKLIPENNRNLQSLDEALVTVSTAPELKELLRAFYGQIKRQDHQILLYRQNKSIDGVILLVKDESNMFVLVQTLFVK